MQVVKSGRIRQLGLPPSLGLGVSQVFFIAEARRKPGFLYTNRKYKFWADSISATKASAYARGLAQAKFSLSIYFSAWI